MREATQHPTLREEDLPAIYQAANANAIDAQNRFLIRTAVGLSLVIVASAVSFFSVPPIRVPLLGPIPDVLGFIGAAAFGGAIFIRLYLLSDRPEKTWFGGRAAAEAARTLAWRYSVGGEPFGVVLDPNQADETFILLLREIMTDLTPAGLAPPPSQHRQISQAMRDLRAMSLEDRKHAYQVGRIEDQLRWYSTKARWHGAMARRWNFALGSLEVVGLIGAILKAMGVDRIAFLGLAGTLVAAGASWLQLKRHSHLAESYSVASQNLAAISDLLGTQGHEEAWARFVNEAEDVISGEHRLWRASRTT